MVVEWSFCCMWCRHQTSAYLSVPSAPNEKAFIGDILDAHKACVGFTAEECRERQEARLDEWRMAHGYDHLVEAKKKVLGR